MTNINYDAIEKLFEQLLSLIETQFTFEELSEIKGFIEVREYGLALQTFIDIVHEEGKRVPLKVFSVVEELAMTMGISDQVDLGLVRSAVD